MDRRSAGMQIGRGNELSFLVTFGEDEQVAPLRPFVGAGRILACTRRRGAAEARRRRQRTEQHGSPCLFGVRFDVGFRSILGG